MNELPPTFPHQPPRGYKYQVVPFKTNIVAVWTVYLGQFVYNSGGVSRSIWGYYNTKKQQYYAPINSKRVGDVVDINRTSPYTAMQLNLTPLEIAFS